MSNQGNTEINLLGSECCEYRQTCLTNWIHSVQFYVCIPINLVESFKFVSVLVRLDKSSQLFLSTCGTIEVQ